MNKVAPSTVRTITLTMEGTAKLSLIPRMSQGYSHVLSAMGKLTFVTITTVTIFLIGPAQFRFIPVRIVGLFLDRVVIIFNRGGVSPNIVVASCRQ